jgi:hypothetical protein
VTLVNRLELALHARVGRRTDQERVDVVVPRHAGVAETLDLVRGHPRDPVLGHIEDRGVVGEVQQRHRGDRRERIVRRHQRDAPRPVRIVVVLVRGVLRERRGPHVLGDRDRLLERIRAIEPLRGLGADRRHQRRLARRRRDLEVGLAAGSAERVHLRVGRQRRHRGRRLDVDLADRARAVGEDARGREPDQYDRDRAEHGGGDPGPGAHPSLRRLS